MDERFVAYFPSLGRLLGSIEGAVLIQFIHWSRNTATGEARLTYAEMSEGTGISERTVRRRMGLLRDGGWVVARRSSRDDATISWRVDVAKIEGASRGGQSGHLETARLATSETDNLATSSTQKEEELLVPVGTDATREEPERHPSRPIASNWTPRPDFHAYLREAYPHADVDSSIRRFALHHFAAQSTSKSWEAKLEVWVDNDNARAVSSLHEGTDDLGVPRTQRRAAGPLEARPGDPDYVDPDTLV